MRIRLFLFLNIVLVAATLGIFSAPEAGAYVRWASGCTDCHSDFRDELSTKPGNVWPDDKHNVHRRSIINDTSSDYCGVCHVTNGDNPLLNGSRGEPGIPGVGCMGCHGVDPSPGVPNNTWWGAGLRLHHANANVGTDNSGQLCADAGCHDDDPSPLGEHSVPIYYGLTDINVLDPCNADGSENWTSDGLGLDNDGDLDYDDADSDCSSALALFSDDFESGDTSAWSAVVP